MKVVIVKQKDFKDCGICCLQSIIKFYHGFVPLEKIRRDACTDSGGTTAYHLIESAKTYGFEALGKRLSYNMLEKQQMPLIAHVIYPDGYAHYIVIYKIKNNKLTVMDPAEGKLNISEKEFKKIWSNVVIIFHPKNKIVNFSKNTSIFSIFLSYIYLFKNKYIIYIIINIFLMILTLIHSLFLSWGIDNLDNYTLFIKIIILMLAIIFGKNSINYLKNKISCVLNFLIDLSLYNDFTKHLFNLPSSFLLNRTNGEVISRMNELGNIKNLLTEIFIALFLDSILILVSLILLGIVNMKIMILLFMVSIVYGFTSVFSSKSLYSNIKEVVEKDSVYNNCLLENINLFNSIKNLNITNKIISKSAEKLKDLCQSNLNFEKKFNKIDFIKNLFNDLIIFLIMSLSIYSIFQNVFNVSDAILFISISSIYFESLKKILNVVPKFIYFKVSFEKINEFYSVEVEKEEGINKIFEIGDIEFKSVAISYDNYYKVLKNINLKIKNKSHTLLTGESGIGKSTLLQCLITKSFYEGDIIISNINIKDYNLKTLRKNIMYVGQNEKLFSDTIYNNITCYENVSPSKFYKICNICMVDDIVKNKPFRYISQIDNELSNLSGGERQRIILARALLKDANIYIFDEALSEVDYKTEVKIIANIKKSFSNKTIIYVSHKNVKKYFKNIVNLKNKEEYE